MDKDLTIIVTYVILGGIILNLSFFEYSLIRIVVGIPFVIFIPGYSLVSAIFIKKDDISWIERIALSFGLSIIIVIMWGLIIEYSHWGLKFQPMFLSLSASIIFLCITSYIVRRRVPMEERFEISLKKLKKEILITPKKRMEKALYILLFLLVGTSLFLLANSYSSFITESKLTEFYILDSTGSVGNFTRQLMVNEPFEMLVGVTNHEANFTVYELKIKINDNFVGREYINLENGKKWEEKVKIVPKITGSNQKVEFLLFKDKERVSPYRSLYIIVDVVGS